MALMSSWLSSNNCQHVKTLISCKPLANLLLNNHIIISTDISICISKVYFLFKITTLPPPLKQNSVISSKRHPVCCVHMSSLILYMFMSLLIHRFHFHFPLPPFSPSLLFSLTILIIFFVAKEIWLFALENSPGLDFADCITVMVFHAFLFPLNYL